LKLFEAIKLLFPRARAFEVFVNNIKRKIIKAFSVLPEDIRHHAELVYMDLFPDTTRFPEKWEQSFAIFFKDQELSKRRAIIDSLWKINMGGQSALFLQDILQAIEPEIKVIQNVPVANPRLIRIVKMAVCGNRLMYCGSPSAACGAKLGSTEFIPSVLRNDVSEFYSIPYDPAYWSMCFFVCRDVLRDANGKIVHIDHLSMSAVWRNYVEYLILKIKPVQDAAIVFIKWED
jgi:uncharacterized protein YmfQ (DUF2313 family)